MPHPLLERFDFATCRLLRRSLKGWYARHARPLPWRETADPYRIWISEIMLQQTTVKAVVPHYERFLARFPTVHHLAVASEAEVLQYWEGLGYYRRGRNLRLAAQRVCEEHGGEFPAEAGALHALPGIGRYTAGAIRSFAFDLPAPIVEANTLRLYCRLLGYDGDPRSSPGQDLLWEFAARLQPSRSAGRVNQALMELGATLCTPKEPRCGGCPVRNRCAAFAESRQEEIPRRQTRPKVTHLVEASVAIQSRERFLVRRRSDEERWAGMWDFLRFPLDGLAPRQKLTGRTLARLLPRLAAGVAPHLPELILDPELVAEFRHSVTRYRIRLLCFRAQTGPESVVGPCFGRDEPLRWLSLEELGDLPMPVTGRRFTLALADSGKGTFGER